MSEADGITRAPTEPFEFRASRAQLALLFLLSLLLASVAFWIARNPEIDPFARLVGWFGAPFFLFCAINYVFRSFNRSILTVSAEGIRDTRISPQFIPWTAVDSISTRCVRQINFTVLRLEATEYAKLQMSPIFKITSRLDQAFGMDGLSISTVGFPVKFYEFHSTVTTFARTRGVKVD